jgi:hypothetical protein
MKKSIMIFALGLSLAAHSQAEKQPIFIHCQATDNDLIGKRLCTALRDEIANSPRYREVEFDAHEAHWNLLLVSVHHDDMYSAEALTLTKGFGEFQIYFSSWVYMTPAVRVKDMSDEIYADVDNEMRKNANQTMPKRSD